MLITPSLFVSNCAHSDRGFVKSEGLHFSWYSPPASAVPDVTGVQQQVCVCVCVGGGGVDY
jgi:hypothetical protein